MRDRRLIGLPVLVAIALSACASGSRSAPPAASGAGTTRTSVTSTVPTTTTTTALAPAQPRVPGDPAALAAQLVADERAVRDAATPKDAFVAAARRIQLAYRTLGRHPEWDATVLPAIPAELQHTVTTNVDARRHLVALVSDTPVKDTLPAWRIEAPAPPDELLSYYHEAEASFGVAWSYLAAINLIETDLGRIVGLSTAGAQGPMQFLPSTWDAYGGGGDINSPHDSILGAARYLAANGFTDGNVDGALQRYNRSVDYVAAVKDYAAVLAAEPGTFATYYEWDVYYFTVAGDILLPIGYEQTDRIPVADYLASHPQ